MGQTVKIRTKVGIEWPTLALIVVCYGGIALALWAPPLLAIPILASLIALHASLQHEAIHLHPTGNAVLNGAILGWPLTLAVPYLRFYDTHLAHHRDARLTDPFDDPESNYFDPGTYDALPAYVRWLLGINNTLLGRVTIGPLIGQVLFMKTDAVRIARCDMRVFLGWALHIPMVSVVLWVLSLCPLPLWAFGVAAYGALAILKIRTYAEHRAHEDTGARTVIIEDRGLLALLFLNNNLHVVHHMHPGLPWYDLPGKFRANRAHYLRRNGGYVFPSYATVFRQYFVRRKDPVPHPLWRR